MSDSNREIAKITGTHLGTEDHGILTCFLYVEYGVGSQGIGGYGLDEWNDEANRRIGTAYGCEFIKRVLKACGVEKWEDLPGRTIYALMDPTERRGFGSKVIGIAPLPTEPGEEFLFDDLRAEFLGDES